MKRKKGRRAPYPSNADNDSTIPNKGYFSARCAKVLPKRPSSGTFYLTPFRAAGRGSMNHEQAMLMKSSRVSDLNTPWEQVLHLASRRVFPKRHTIDVSNTESPYFYYILSGTVRLAYVGANGEERTILYAGAGTLMNVPTIIAGDIKNTVVTCTERVEAAIFDAGLLTDRAFAAAHPDLLLNLIHSLCIHLVIHSQHLGDASLVGTMGHVCRVFQEMSQKYGGRPRFSPDMTQQELAALLGIHRTTLTRILCRLKALNIIEKYTKNDLHILDMEALDRLARGDKR